MIKIKNQFQQIPISKITYYGNDRIGHHFPGVQLEYTQKNFDGCIKLCKNSIYFGKAGTKQYTFNKNFNSCWGHKLAISKDGKIKPCIYSDLEIGDLDNAERSSLFTDASFYWNLTKDCIEKCKDCEFKYLCFDCREISRKRGESLYSANPYCKYNPYQGIWED